MKQAKVLVLCGTSMRTTSAENPGEDSMRDSSKYWRAGRNIKKKRKRAERETPKNDIRNEKSKS